MSKFNVGDKVKYIGNDHKEMPEYYPEVGAVGIIEDIKTPNAWVQWPNGSTSKNDCWCCSLFDIEKIIENITNEEIWEMLKPKMEKNGLEAFYHATPYHYVLSYNCVDAQKAIALAYRSGYERAMKGRPFKFGEKKKKGGHWEPIDPKNLPKEGTRVRYSRPICFEDEFYLIGWNVGDEGIVNYHENYFGVKREGKNWDGVGMFGYYFDMWVEDDE